MLPTAKQLADEGLTLSMFRALCDVEATGQVDSAISLRTVKTLENVKHLIQPSGTPGDVQWLLTGAGLEVLERLEPRYTP